MNPVAAPINLAAIDAGSNAIRIAVVCASSPRDWKELYRKRYPIRLGAHAFADQILEDKPIAESLRVFRHFRSLLRRYGVKDYRAVATSATRQAKNGKDLCRAIEEKTAIPLEIIEGKEEARLGAVAVDAWFKGRDLPKLIIDLGGGSLELNCRYPDKLERVFTLPLGTVRLMEKFKVQGMMDPALQKKISKEVLSKLTHSVSKKIDFSPHQVVALGGNATSLGKRTLGKNQRKTPTLDLPSLARLATGIYALDVEGRRKAYGVRKDRAEIWGIAALVFLTLGRWLNVERFLVPDVGVREGILHELATRHFSQQKTASSR